jgi:P27 family predicted phage terminase small subunit
MARAKKTKPNRPAPPEEIEDEARLEWDRVCDELDSAGRLATTDRAILHVYVELWALHRRAVRQVTVHGFTTTYSNDNVGLSPAYNAMKDSARQLRTLLNDLGLTPAKRGKGPNQEADDDLPL